MDRNRVHAVTLGLGLFGLWLLLSGVNPAHGRLRRPNLHRKDTVRRVHTRKPITRSQHPLPADTKLVTLPVRLKDYNGLPDRAACGRSCEVPTAGAKAINRPAFRQRLPAAPPFAAVTAQAGNQWTWAGTKYYDFTGQPGSGAITTALGRRPVKS